MAKQKKRLNMDFMDFFILWTVCIGSILLASYAGYRVGKNEGRGSIKVVGNKVTLKNIDLSDTTIAVQDNKGVEFVNCDHKVTDSANLKKPTRVYFS